MVEDGDTKDSQQCGVDSPNIKRKYGGDLGRGVMVYEPLMEKNEFELEKTDKCNDVFKEVRRTREKFPVWLVLCAISCTFGASSQFGFTTGVITVPAHDMRIFYNVSHYSRRDEYLEPEPLTWLWSFTVSIYCIGALLGSLSSGFLSNKLGRKGATLFSNVFSIGASILLGFSLLLNSYELIIVGRFISGYHTGVINSVVPMYLAEIAPTSWRGAVGILHAILMCLGINAAQVVGFYVFNGEDDWPLLLALIPFVLSVFQLVTLPFCPESPRWLYINKNDKKGAEVALKKFRSTDDVSAELQDMEISLKEENELVKMGMGTFLKKVFVEKPEWRLPFLICCLLCFGLHMSGINAIWFYVTDIFELANLTYEQAAYGTVFLGFINVAGSVFSSAMIDKVGRRPLTIYPSLMLAGILGALTVCLVYIDAYEWMYWLTLFLISAVVFCLSGGPGPMIYVINAEIWEQEARPAAMSLALVVNWLTNFMIATLFPFAQNALGPYVFLIFAGTMLVIGIFEFFYLPETKNRTFQQISQHIKQEHERRASQGSIFRRMSRTSRTSVTQPPSAYMHIGGSRKTSEATDV